MDESKTLIENYFDEKQVKNFPLRPISYFWYLPMFRMPASF